MSKILHKMSSVGAMIHYTKGLTRATSVLIWIQIALSSCTAKIKLERDYSKRLLVKYTTKILNFKFVTNNKKAFCKGHVLT